MKHYLDSLFFLLTGVICLAFISGGIWTYLKEGFSIILIPWIGLFLYSAILQLHKFYVFITIPSDVLKINKNAPFDFVLTTSFGETISSISNIRVLEYKLHKEKYEIDNHLKFRYWISCSMVLMDGNRKHMIDINPSAIIESSSYHSSIENELRTSAKKLMKTIAQHLNTEVRWKGKVEEK